MCPAAADARGWCMHTRPTTSASSGPAYDLTFCEVRDTSLVLLWKPPVYSGSGPITGYFVDYKEEDAGEWGTVNEAATANRYLKVTLFPPVSPTFPGRGLWSLLDGLDAARPAAEAAQTVPCGAVHGPRGGDGRCVSTVRPVSYPCPS